MKVAAAQIMSKPGAFEENFEKIITFTKEASKKEAKLILFPEFAFSGLTFDRVTLEKGMNIFKTYSKDLVELSKNLDIAIVFGIPRIASKKFRNSIAIVIKENIIFYDKIHLFNGERNIFEPGKKLTLFEFNKTLFGVFLCYEIGFPEVARILSLKGAEVLLVSFALSKKRWKIYDLMTKVRAIENGVFLVASSTVGDGFVENSRIVHPSGEILAEINEKEGIIVADLNLEDTKKYKYIEEEDSYAYLKNRKPTLYQDIIKI